MYTYTYIHINIYMNVYDYICVCTHTSIYVYLYMTIYNTTRKTHNGKDQLRLIDLTVHLSSYM